MVRQVQRQFIDIITVSYEDPHAPLLRAASIRQQFL